MRKKQSAGGVLAALVCLVSILRLRHVNRPCLLSAELASTILRRVRGGRRAPLDVDLAPVLAHQYHLAPRHARRARPARRSSGRELRALSTVPSCRRDTVVCSAAAALNVQQPIQGRH